MKQSKTIQQERSMPSEPGKWIASFLQRSGKSKKENKALLEMIKATTKDPVVAGKLKACLRK